MFGHKCFLRVGTLSDSSISGLYRESYELLNCNFSFSQGIDNNGKTQSDIKGGSIRFTFPNLPTEEMVQWMLKSNKLESGAIVICDNDDVPLEKILFEDSACINMNINYTQGGKNYMATQMEIQARKITVEEATLENNWKNL